jgi:prophage antirepressor-like protein
MFDNESFGRIFGELKPTLQKAGMSLTQIFEMEKKLRKAVEDVEPLLENHRQSMHCSMLDGKLAMLKHARKKKRKYMEI